MPYLSFALTATFGRFTERSQRIVCSRHRPFSDLQVGAGARRLVSVANARLVLCHGLCAAPARGARQTRGASEANPPPRILAVDREVSGRIPGTTMVVALPTTSRTAAISSPLHTIPVAPHRTPRARP
jgi:hypothetical protein